MGKKREKRDEFQTDTQMTKLHFALHPEFSCLGTECFLLGYPPEKAVQTPVAKHFPDKDLGDMPSLGNDHHDDITGGGKHLAKSQRLHGFFYIHAAASELLCPRGYFTLLAQRQEEKDTDKLAAGLTHSKVYLMVSESKSRHSRLQHYAMKNGYLDYFYYCIIPSSCHT